MVASCLGRREQVIQLHFGGGTPTFLSDAQLERLMTLLKTHFEFLKEGSIP